MHDLSVDVGQTEVAALVAVGHPFVVDAHLVQDCRVEIVDVDRVLLHVVAEIIRLAMDDPRLDAAAGHPFCVTARVVIAAVVCLGEASLAVDRAAEFAAPDNQRVFQKSSLFQILDEGIARLIDDPTLPTNVVWQIAVLIPLTNEDLRESHTTFG